MPEQAPAPVTTPTPTRTPAPDWEPYPDPYSPLRICPQQKLDHAAPMAPP